MPEGVELAVLDKSIRLLALLPEGVTRFLPEGVTILLPEGVTHRSKCSEERRIVQHGLISLSLHPPSDLSGWGPFFYCQDDVREHENSLQARC